MHLNRVLYDLSPDGAWPDFWLFFEHDGETPLSIRPEYAFLACSGCGKFDSRECLEHGISEEVEPPDEGLDVYLSADGAIVVSERCKDVLLEIPGVHAKFYAVPERPEYFAMYPLRAFQLLPKASIQQTIGGLSQEVQNPKCGVCGRFSNALGVSPLFSPSEDEVFLGVLIEVPRTTKIDLRACLLIGEPASRELSSH
jgi:hypothetical protein